MVVTVAEADWRGKSYHFTLYHLLSKITSDTHCSDFRGMMTVHNVPGVTKYFIGTPAYPNAISKSRVHFCVRLNNNNIIIILLPTFLYLIRFEVS